MALRDDTLVSIDSKLSALLTLTLDDYLRRTGVARPKTRSIDRMLSDAGLTPGQIAPLLGKTERAVNLALQREREKGDRKRKPKKRVAK
jgi:DNA-directed RNA polymerase specialized sigma24 family protein